MTRIHRFVGRSGAEFIITTREANAATIWCSIEKIEFKISAASEPVEITIIESAPVGNPLSAIIEIPALGIEGRLEQDLLPIVISFNGVKYVYDMGPLAGMIDLSNLY